jgi:hypothetical protein
MTSVESINEKIQQIKSESLEKILSVSGSAAISKNEYGINVVDSNNVASSLVFKGLTKDKYDNEELVKAVDVEVKELLPNIPTSNLDLVPRPLYTEQVNLVEDLRKQVQILTLTIADLNSQITTLQAQVQTEVNNRLSIEQTNDLLVNQIETLNATIEDFTSQVGYLGILGAFFILLICATAFAYNETAGIIMMNLGVMFVNIIKFSFWFGENLIFFI